MLTREQTAQYQRDGYTLFPGFLSSEEVAALLSDIESICAGNTLAKHDKSRLEMEPSQPPDGARVRRVYEPCTYYPRFRALLRVGAIASVRRATLRIQPFVPLQ